MGGHVNEWCQNKHGYHHKILVMARNTAEIRLMHVNGNYSTNIYVDLVFNYAQMLRIDRRVRY